MARSLQLLDVEPIYAREGQILTRAPVLWRLVLLPPHPKSRHVHEKGSWKGARGWLLSPIELSILNSSIAFTANSLVQQSFAWTTVAGEPNGPRSGHGEGQVVPATELDARQARFAPR